ncbi:MAG: hypothetical protein ACMUJM_20215 [bacterium]
MEKSRTYFNFFVTMIILFISSTAMAGQIGSIWHSPAFSTQPHVLPAQSLTTGDILVDNFEYWDSPYNHGWLQATPPYPVHGFGIGYSVNFETIVDYREGSRVMNAFRPSSEFLLSTEYEKYFVTKFLESPPTSSNPHYHSGISLDQNSPDRTAILSFKFWAPMGIELWDIFEFHVHGTTLGEDGISGTGDDKSFVIQIRPLDQPYSNDIDRGVSGDNMGDNYASLHQAGSATTPMVIQVDIGRNYNSDTWQVIWLDLNEINEKAHSGTVPTGWELGQATHVRAGGPQFRLDDIIFRKKDYPKLWPPDLIEIGPRYAQLYESLRFLFMAAYQSDGEIAQISDLLLDSANFITDREKIIETWIEDSRVGGIIQMDPNYLDPNHARYGHPEPYYSEVFGRDFIIDTTLPLFADRELRIGGVKAASLRMQALGWKASVGGYGEKGVRTLLLDPLPINPYDGMPTYIILYYYSGFKAIHSEKRFPSPSFGLAQYGSKESFILESAMWNANFSVWPNIAYMDFTPQVLENYIITLEVTNGIATDLETFPLCVVNYPVENYAPSVQRLICATLFTPWEYNECIILFSDPDCLIFSLAQFEGRIPATDHLPALAGNKIRDDQDQFVFTMTINGLPNYQYGPWVETIIDPYSGLTSLIPKFESTLHTVVTCTDNRGGISQGSRPIFIVDKGTWFNHAPLAVGNPKKPQVARAGEEFFITAPYMMVIEPDGEPLYASCNIGAIGKKADGTFIWTLHTDFPGVYDVELFFYDSRGASTVSRFPVDVIPWWSE